MKIKELRLYTSNLVEQFEFYSNVLKFEVLNKTSKKCSFRVGKSMLTFIHKINTAPYHFAFNIPSNKENEALNWLKKRVEILSFEGNEIVNFKSWNAKAIYFYDKDFNIVEFIARKNLNENSSTDFSSASIFDISEIGMPTNNIEATYNELNDLKEIAIYGGDFELFCAIGNEEGLFILVNEELKTWFPTGEKAYQSDFVIKGDFNFEYTNGKIIQIT